MQWPGLPAPHPGPLVVKERWSLAPASKHHGGQAGSSPISGQPPSSELLNARVGLKSLTTVHTLCAAPVLQDPAAKTPIQHLNRLLFCIKKKSRPEKPDEFPKVTQ